MSSSQHYIRTIQTSFTATSSAWAATTASPAHHQQYIWSSPSDIPNGHRLPPPPGLGYPSHHHRSTGTGGPSGAAPKPPSGASGPAAWNYNRRRSSVPPRMNANHFYHHQQPAASTPGVPHHYQQPPQPRRNSFVHEEVAVHQQRHHQPRCQAQRQLPSLGFDDRSVYAHPPPPAQPTFTFDPFFDDPLTPSSSASSAASVPPLASASSPSQRLNNSISKPPGLVSSPPQPQSANTLNNANQKRSILNVAPRARSNSISVLSPPPSALPPPSFPTGSSGSGVARASADYTHMYTSATGVASAPLAPPPLFPHAQSRLYRRSPSPPQAQVHVQRQDGKTKTHAQDVAIPNHMPNPIHIQLNAVFSRPTTTTVAQKAVERAAPAPAPTPAPVASPAPAPTRSASPPTPAPLATSLVQSNAEKERQARLRLIAGILLNRVYDVSKKSSSSLRAAGKGREYVKSSLSTVVSCEA
ncbi:hypothetical protein AX16_010934 [Volvariella volvacea WC 439]|nr:hypothetical protein AX16_010934 [Volvariella volvacea WC 439]